MEGRVSFGDGILGCSPSRLTGELLDRNVATTEVANILGEFPAVTEASKLKTIFKGNAR